MHLLTTILLGVLTIGGILGEENDDTVDLGFLAKVFELTVEAYPPVPIEVHDTESKDFVLGIAEVAKKYGLSILYNLYQQCKKRTAEFLCNLNDLYDKLQCAIDSVGEGEDNCLDGPLSDLDKQLQIIINDFQPGDLPEQPALEPLPDQERTAIASTKKRPLHSFMVGFTSVMDRDITSMYAMNVGSMLCGWRSVRKNMYETAQQFRNEFLSQIVCAAAKIAHNVFNEETVVQCHSSDRVWGTFTTDGSCLMSYCTNYYNGSYCE